MENKKKASNKLSKKQQLLVLQLIDEKLVVHNNNLSRYWKKEHKLFIKEKIYELQKIHKLVRELEVC